MLGTALGLVFLFVGCLFHAMGIIFRAWHGMAWRWGLLGAVQGFCCGFRRPGWKEYHL